MCEHRCAHLCCQEISKQLLEKQCFINRGKYLQMTQSFSLPQALKKINYFIHGYQQLLGTSLLHSGSFPGFSFQP